MSQSSWVTSQTIVTSGIVLWATIFPQVTAYYGPSLTQDLGTTLVVALTIVPMTIVFLGTILGLVILVINLVTTTKLGATKQYLIPLALVFGLGWLILAGFKT